MPLFSKLFGGGSSKEPEPETYQGFRIYPTPEKESGGYRLAARIEKEVGGETRRQHFIRADVFSSEDEARAASVRKAKQLIDESGDALFG